MVREYARERLAERGEHDATMHRFACYLRDFRARAGAALDGPDNHAWLAQLDAELDNLRAGLGRRGRRGRACDPHRRAAVALLVAARPAGRDARPGGAHRGVAVGGDALPRGRRAAAVVPRDHPHRVRLDRDAEPILRQLVDRARELGDARLLAHGLTGLALTLPFERSAAQVRDLPTEALALFRRAGDSWGIGFVLGPLGQVTLRDGDPRAAAATRAPPRRCTARCWSAPSTSTTTTCAPRH